jgi:hypothetical protein
MPNLKQGKPMKDASNAGWAVKVTEIPRSGKRRETFLGGATPAKASAAAEKYVEARQSGSAAGWKGKKKSS